MSEPAIDINGAEPPQAIAPMPPPPPPPAVEPEEQPKPKKVSRKKAQSALARINEQSPDMTVEELEAYAHLGKFVVDLGGFAFGAAEMTQVLKDARLLDRTFVGRASGDVIDDDKDTCEKGVAKPNLDQLIRIDEGRLGLLKLRSECAATLMKSSPPPDSQGNKPSSPFVPFPANQVVQHFHAAPPEPKQIES